MASRTLLAATLLGLAVAQTPGSGTENHPALKTWKCTKAGGCSEKNSYVVIDSASHWIHQKNNTALGCGNWGSAADPTACPDEETCAKNCIMEPISDYTNNAIYTSGDELKLDMFNQAGSTSSPRLYLLGEDKKNYEMLQLTGGELSFDVDVSHLPCGMNGALYLSEMKADGGRSALNPGGATYGTGYCDAQCFVTPWVDGVGNIEGKGVCCNEMDIWEANARSNQIAPHTCGTESLFTCTGTDECGPTGVCDKYGCGDNPYLHRDDKTFYGLGLKVDTKRPFTVVTQFPAKDGVLQSIVRKYVQDGVVIENAKHDLITMDQPFCDAQGGAAQFNKLGGLKGMGDALARGMVLAMSIWWDEGGSMTWLDSGSAGPCNATEGAPSFIKTIEPNPTVTFSKIKWGELDSTYGGATNATALKWRA